VVTASTSNVRTGPTKKQTTEKKRGDDDTRFFPPGRKDGTPVFFRQEGRMEVDDGYCFVFFENLSM